MKFNKKPYRTNKPELVKHFQESGIDYVSFYCSVSTCPAIAAYSYLLEEFPDDLNLQNRLEKLMMFYGYKEVIDEWV